MPWTYWVLTYGPHMCECMQRPAVRERGGGALLGERRKRAERPTNWRDPFRNSTICTFQKMRISLPGVFCTFWRITNSFGYKKFVKSHPSSWHALLLLLPFPPLAANQALPFSSTEEEEEEEEEDPVMFDRAEEEEEEDGGEKNSVPPPFPPFPPPHGAFWLSCQESFTSSFSFLCAAGGHSLLRSQVRRRGFNFCNFSWLERGFCFFSAIQFVRKDICWHGDRILFAVHIIPTLLTFPFFPSSVGRGLFLFITPRKWRRIKEGNGMLSRKKRVFPQENTIGWWEFYDGENVVSVGFFFFVGAHFWGTQ